MKHGIKAIQCHMIENEDMPLEKQHRHCPNGKDTWSKFWADKHNKNTSYDNSNRLPEIFMKEFLSDDSLLTRSLQKLTQNQNESVNAQLWSRCSKTTFLGVRRVRIAVCETVAVFNTGATNKAAIINLCGVNPAQNIWKALSDQKCRIKRFFKVYETKKNFACKEKHHAPLGLLVLTESLRYRL